MRPTFLGFETGRRAIMASQKGIDITGHNVSNSANKNYTRQRVDVYSVYPYSSGYRYTTGIKSVAGQGVGISGIGQVRDPYLDNHFRMEYQEFSKLDVMSDGLSQVEDILDEVTSKHFTENLDEMFNQLQKLSKDADRPEFANILVSKSKELVYIFNTYANDLTKSMQKQKYELDNKIMKVNDIVKKIASLNKDIRDEYVAISLGSQSALGPRINENYGPNELLDDRNALLDELSGLVNIEVIPKDDGTVNVKMGDLMLVEKFESGNFTIDPGISAPVDFSSNFKITFEGKKADGTEIKKADDFDVIKNNCLTAGELKGYMQVLTGKGDYADTAKGENNTFQGLPYYMEIVNSFARTFADAFNNANKVSVPNAMDLFTFDPDKEPNSAANIRVNPKWIDDPLGGLQSGLKPDAGDSANNNILAMIKVFDQKLSFTRPGQTKPDGTPVEELNGTFKEYIKYYTSKLGQDVSFYGSLSKNRGMVSGAVDDQRLSVSSVDLNEEGINMMMYQKAFNAASRFVTVLDQSLDTIINNMGIVGR